MVRNRSAYLKEMQEFCAKFVKPVGERLFNCGIGQSGCVDAYGFFQPCLLLRHPDTVYDLSKGSLSEALTVFSPQVSKMKAANPDYLNRCGRCFIKGLCEQCPAKSWMEHGTLDTPVEYLCQIAHQEGIYLGLLQAGEKAWEVPDGKNRLKKYSQ